MGQLLFARCINDLDIVITSDIRKVAHDTFDQSTQTTIQRFSREMSLFEWAGKWMMQSNNDICNVLIVGRNYLQNNYTFNNTPLN